MNDPTSHPGQAWDRLQEFLTVTHRLLADVQAEDGYLDSHFQVRSPGQRFVEQSCGRRVRGNRRREPAHRSRATLAGHGRDQDLHHRGDRAHHSDEAFGDPYELPKLILRDLAAIASIMFCWRMLQITGEARYADLIERTHYNGFLAGPDHRQ